MTTENTTTISRINAILRGEKLVSHAAFNYLTVLLESRDGDIERLARMTTASNAGICVVNEGDGDDDFVYYGDYPAWYCGNINAMDCSWLDIDGILDVMEDDDGIPDWWESDWTYIETDDGWTSRGE
jgi:hypothetical protein